MDCIFCAIADGAADARVVAETESALAFLDANPLAPGHTLVVPKDHYETLDDLPPAEGRAVFSLLHRLVPAIEAAVDADGSTVGFNNGAAAGQEVDHVHGHVIPRFAGDGGGPIHGVVGSRPDLDEGDLDDIAAHIAAAVGE
ncbi:HIT family protein [Halanaeroarchaeum sulfurireducens]|uniref:Histidine triad (HIT) hydrolase n=1 Tax=Halanaeroarchaeum sulfurireducens TaxID=1604004 RepID=A0A0F7PAL0_9EURY|nr:HIT family protein [Halanaeroarchaeum sulfurireducens]AKH96654.1 histidine triad (HIT) hydrolase [Halanaeroarchaeum sulfurireducens]ALG81056.1 histidine triad (HIT) hydrolase [Halanaeroarchaeum sulfurireducens]